jgi:ribosomal protein L17
MEEEVTDTVSSEEPKPEKKHIPEVYILRDWKEYMGESFLIIFSVILALVLTEFFNNLHEKSETREILKNLREELIQNKQFETEQYAYHLKVMRNIDSALVSPAIQKKVVSNDEFHLTVIIPNGVLYRYLNNVAWDVAKSHNIYSKIDFKTTSLLTHIYEEQLRINKVEDEIAKVFLSRDAGKLENAHATLILIKNNYKGWAVDRAPGLIAQYSEAIKLLDKDK